MKVSVVIVDANDFNCCFSTMGKNINFNFVIIIREKNHRLPDLCRLACNRKC